jgi:hypothetical protein
MIHTLSASDAKLLELKMGTRIVTENDLRKEEFKDKNPSDYEFRSDGVIVRKDRWERAVLDIANLVGVSTRDFEIDDIILAVNALVDNDVERQKQDDESRFR